MRYAQSRYRFSCRTESGREKKRKNADAYLNQKIFSAREKKKIAFQNLEQKMKTGQAILLQDLHFFSSHDLKNFQINGKSLLHWAMHFKNVNTIERLGEWYCIDDEAILFFLSEDYEDDDEVNFVNMAVAIMKHLPYELRSSVYEKIGMRLELLIASRESEAKSKLLRSKLEVLAACIAAEEIKSGGIPKVQNLYEKRDTAFRASVLTRIK